MYWLSEPGAATIDLDAIRAKNKEDKMPRSVMVQEVRRITLPDELRKLAGIVEAGKEAIAQVLNAEPRESGFTMVLGMRGWGA